MIKSLVGPQVMVASLKALLDSADKWSIYLNRSPLDWSTGQRQSTGLILSKGDGLNLSGVPDVRLMRARRVRIVLSFPDQGAALIDLTRRETTYIISSPDAKAKIKAFDEALRSGQRRSIFGRQLGLHLLDVGLLLFFLLSGIAILTDPGWRAYFADRTGAVPAPETVPLWMIWPTIGLLAFTLVGALIALISTVIRIMSGGLRVWPESLTRVSGLTLLYRIRAEGLRVDNWRQLAVGVLIGILIAVATFWFGGSSTS